MSKSRIWCIEQGISCVSRMEIQYLERSETFQMFTSAVVGRRTTGVPSQRVLNEKEFVEESPISPQAREGLFVLHVSGIRSNLYNHAYLFFSGCT